ncbi:hypothetical protein SEPCBS57363_002885 [Sporothrix epigloea]|uniref:Zn(2)-C6 fungal-type domain-containing protein n=1 Tax=Sporothrix epigloea TaxID=1892477 RepID=A0ABP0DIC0_9PEZI
MSTTSGVLATAPKDRPYRSHVQPACLPCRKRKSRCKVVAGKASCLFCEAYATECVFPTQKERRISTARTETRVETAKSPGKRVRQVAQTQTTSQTSQVGQIPSPFSGRRLSGTAAPSTKINADGDEDNTHIVGPVEAKDSRVLADYLSTETTASWRPWRSGTQHSVLFRSIRKRPLGFALAQTRSARKCEILEKMLEPWLDELIDLFFLRVNSCFPILDKTSFVELFCNDRSRISPALLSAIYAHTLTYWNSSPALSSNTNAVKCPDVRFIWNQANEAIYSELHLSPGISTIIGIILNVGGRPTTSILGNSMQLGSAVSLANSLGLNRDPTEWDNIPEHEKQLRKRIWWGLFVHDKWCSLAYGTPPRIQRSYHDVPLPQINDLVSHDLTDDSTTEEREAASIYTALVSLTDVLDLYLEKIYNLHEDDQKPLAIHHLSDRLADWEASLRGDLRRIVLRGTVITNRDYPGSANLRLAYLAVQLLRQRVEPDTLFDGTMGYSTGHNAVRKAAEDIVFLVEELTEDQLADFWLPTSAFTLASAATSLLRCALEPTAVSASASTSTSTTSISLVKQLLNSLKRHRESSGWDVADICLTQYGEIVEKLAHSTGSGDTPPQDPAILMPDVFMDNVPNVPDIDAMFPSLWDVFTNNSF